MAFPVSVIVPHLPDRRKFLDRFCIPSILANDPLEVLVEQDIEPYGNGNLRRNLGAKRAKGEFLAFIDDDVILASDFLLMLYRALLENPSSSYAYSDSFEVFLPGYPNGNNESRLHKAGDFDPRRLCQANYISTMCLIRREAFPGFDPNIRRLQDWDLWLTMLGNGCRGTYVGQALFWNCHFDAGITVREPIEFWSNAVKAKHAALRARYVK